jgi:serine/threonine protein kinase
VKSRSNTPPAHRIYEQAIAIEDEAARQSFVEEACRDDPALHRRVEQLLQLAGADGRDGLAADDFARMETRLDNRGSRAFVGSIENADTPSTLFHDATRFDPPSISAYQIRRVIGEGGMGTVYLAEQTEPIRREVALKVIKPGMDSQDAIARFEAERQALAMMDHPNIAKVLDGGTTDQGRLYFVMELVRGVPITAYCKRQGLSLHRRLELFIDLCLAVHHAHQRGILHRDLKPGNILVAEHDSKPVVKVIDFGVAKALQGELTERTLVTHRSQVIGTPLYMSPEQAVRSKDDVDTRTDVYSLGVILYELLTGTTPIDRETYSRVGVETFCSLIAQRDPLRPSVRVSKVEQGRSSATAADGPDVATFRPKQLRRELDWIVMKAIERDRDRRYSSASEFAEDVRRFLQGEPVVACPPSWFYRARKTASHYRVELGILAFVMAALLVVAVVSRWQVSAVEVARQESQARELRAIHLLQALKLQSALTALREENLVQMRSLMVELDSDPILRSESAFPSHLAALLTATANPPAATTFINSSGIHNLAVASGGETVVSVDERGDVKLWHLDTADENPLLLGSHGEPSHAVAISPDGRIAVTGSTSGQIAFWDLAERTLIRMKQPVTSGLETLCWSPDGKFIAGGSRYSEVWVCDADGNEYFRFQNNHRHESLLFSRDSTQLIVPTRDNIAVLELPSGKKIRRIFTQPLQNVRVLCWAGENQQWLVAGERFNESLAVIDFAKGQLVGQVPLGVSYPRSLCASANGGWLRAGYTDGRVQLIQLSPGDGGKSITGRVVAQFQAHEPRDDDRLPLASTYSGNDTFASAGQDGRLKLWNQQDLRRIEVRKRPGSVLTSYLIPSSGCIHHLIRPKTKTAYQNAMIFSPEIIGDHFAIANQQAIWIFGIDDQNPSSELKPAIPEIRSLAMADGGNRLCASSGKAVCIWETQDNWTTSDLLNVVEIPHVAPPIFCDDGQSLIINDTDSKQLLLVDIRSVETSVMLPEVDAAFVCIDSAQRQVAFSNKQEVVVFDRRTREVILREKRIARDTMLRFTDDGTVLLQAHRDARIDSWHLPTGQRIGALYDPDASLGTLLRWQLSSENPRLMLELASDYGGSYLLVLPGGNR